MIDVWLLAAKFGFLALLYSFVFWAVRAVWSDAKADETSEKIAPESFVTISAKDHGMRAYRLADETLIGRSAQNDISIDDSAVSATHSRLFRKSGSWFVEDLGSSNGTFVNGRKIANKRRVDAGDVIKVGRTELSLRPKGEIR